MASAIEVTNEVSYQAARKVANLLMKAGNAEDFCLVDRRHEGVNPSYNQTKQGLFLEVSDGKPVGLFTPWGLWYFAGGSADAHSNPHLKAALDALETTVFAEKDGTDVIYALHRVGDKELPAPELASKTEVRPGEVCSKEWVELTGRYFLR